MRHEKIRTGAGKWLLAVAAACMAVPVGSHAQGLNAGLQARWSFDEATGLTATDSSGNGLNGSLVNFLGDDSQWVPGQTGGAILFDGQNYVEVPDAPQIGADLTGGFSVAVWFKSNIALSSNGNTYRMLEKGDSIFLVQGNGDVNNVGNGGMNLLVKTGGALRTASILQPLEANRWYHLVGTFDGVDLRIYLDGALRNTRNVGGPIDDDKLPLRIGSDDSGKFFNGAMDEVSIWNRALTDREVRNLLGFDLPEPPTLAGAPQPATKYAGSTARFSVDARGEEPFQYVWFKDGEMLRSAITSELNLFNIQPADAGSYTVRITNARGQIESDPVTLTVLPVEGLGSGQLALWKFDETAGFAASDASGNSRAGELLDYADETSHWVEGKKDGALQFDGLMSRVVVPGTEALDMGPEASFAFWIKPEGYGTEQSGGTYNFRQGRIVRKGGHVDIFTVDNPGGVRETITANNASAPQVSLKLGEWQHFAVVFRAGTVQFYKGGFPIGSAVAGQLGAPALANLVIGNFDEGTATPRFFQGALDELGIWERPLSDGEILELAGRDISGPPVFALQPVPLERLAGNSAEFSILVTGKRPVTYQWLRDGEAISNSDTNRLFLAKVTLADAGIYTVVATNSEGEATSEAAELIVTEITDVTTGLLGYWPFDDAAENRASDASGHGHHGALQNFPTDPVVPGQVGGAFDFDGADDFIVVPHDDGLSLVDVGTLSVWVNLRSFDLTGDYGRIIRKSINYDWSIYDVRQAPRVFGFNKAAYDPPANSVALNLWTHLAVVFKEGTVQFFKDGAASGSPVAGRLDAATADALVIGNFQPDLVIKRLFNGAMDELGVWNRALSFQEIDGIYQNGLLGKPLTASFEPVTIRSLSVGGGSQAELQFYSPYPDRPYALEFKTALSDPEWQEVAGGQLTDLGLGQFKIEFSRGATATGFYRISSAPPPPVFQDDFESGAPGWTHGGVEDNWELGAPTTGPNSAHSGMNVYATGLAADYAPSTDAYLRTPVIDLTGVAKANLMFWEYRDVDAQIIYHYTTVRVLNADNLTLIEELARDAGTTPGWQPRTLPLTGDSSGRRIIIEFRLVVDPFEPRQGWYLDDVSVQSQ